MAADQRSVFVMPETFTKIKFSDTVFRAKKRAEIL